MKRLRLWVLGVICVGMFFACSRQSVQHASPQEQIQKERVAFAAFLAENKKDPGVIVLSDSLQYKVLQSATTAATQHPMLNDTVRVLYVGSLLNGAVFDSTRSGDTFQTAIRGVILGWQRILPLMKIGDKWRVYMNADLAYGDRGSGTIPGGAGLLFDMHLVGIKPYKATQ